MHIVLMLDLSWNIWLLYGPHTSHNINKLESVQKRATRYVMSDYSRYSSITNMLSVLKWGSLKWRWDNQSLCIFYKILNDLVGVSLPDCVIPNPLVTKGHNKRFINISTTMDSYKYSLFTRLIPLWNSLHSELVDVPTLQQFMLHL